MQLGRFVHREQREGLHHRLTGLDTSDDSIATGLVIRPVATGHARASERTGRIVEIGSELQHANERRHCLVRTTQLDERATPLLVCFGELRIERNRLIAVLDCLRRLIVT